MIPKKAIRTADIMAGLGVIFLTLAHFITNVAMWYLMKLTTISDSVETVARAYEANPLAITLLSATQGYELMIAYVFFPAFILTIYYIMRKNYVRTQPLVLVFAGCILFFLGLMNVLNDAGNLLGLMLQQGLI